MTGPDVRSEADGQIEEGHLVLLLGPQGERHVVRAEAHTVRVPRLGVVRLEDLLGRPWGTKVRIGLEDYRLVRPNLGDQVQALRRGPQIITPKDAARILYETGLGAGDRVLEAGAGSGALTLALAHAVSPGGRVYAYDLRQVHLDGARRNVQSSPWRGSVEFRLGDVRAGVPETGLDAIVLDVPDPEAAVPALIEALRLGGTFALYTPTIEQAANGAGALRAAGCGEVRTLELLERAWVLHERGSRPDFEMLGHTGFLTFGRRFGRREPPPVGGLVSS